MQKPRSDAPAELDDVRTLLNTWHLPHLTRVPVDDLTALASDRSAWTAARCCRSAATV